MPKRGCWPGPFRAESAEVCTAHSRQEDDPFRFRTSIQRSLLQFSNNQLPTRTGAVYLAWTTAPSANGKRSESLASRKNFEFWPGLWQVQPGCPEARGSNNDLVQGEICQ